MIMDIEWTIEKIKEHHIMAFDVSHDDERKRELIMPTNKDGRALIITYGDDQYGTFSFLDMNVVICGDFDEWINTLFEATLACGQFSRISRIEGTKVIEFHGHN